MTTPDNITIDPSLIDLYKDLHRNPELGFREGRTASIVVDHLRASGFEVTTGVGKTGVVGVLRNGDGPIVASRADMDALPVREDTGLDYASTATATDDDGESVPVAHACGHDLHTTCLLGAAAVLAAETSAWSGTLIVVFQPAEELGAGAQAMVDDGLWDRFRIRMSFSVNTCHRCRPGRSPVTRARRTPARILCGYVWWVEVHTARCRRPPSTPSCWRPRRCCDCRP